MRKRLYFALLCSLILSACSLSTSTWKWTNPTLPVQTYIGIVFGNDVYVLVSAPSSGETATRAFVSNDLVNWTMSSRIVANGNAHPQILSFSEEQKLFFIISNQGHSFSSSDGLHWKLTNPPSPISLASVYYGNGLWWATNNSDSYSDDPTIIYRSSDAVHWQEVLTLEKWEFKSAQFVKDVFFVHYLNQTNNHMQLARTKDGKTWDQIDITAQTGLGFPTMKGCAVDDKGGIGGSLLANGYTMYAFVRSTDDGITWNITWQQNGPVDGDPNAMSGVFFYDGIYYWPQHAVAYQVNQPLYSTDYGKTWKPYPIQQNPPLNLVTVNNILFSLDQLKISTDALNWKNLNNGVTSSINSITVYPPTQTLIVASDSVYSSDDAASWKIADNRSLNNIRWSGDFLYGRELNAVAMRFSNDSKTWHSVGIKFGSVAIIDYLYYENSWTGCGQTFIEGAYVNNYVASGTDVSKFFPNGVVSGWIHKCCPQVWIWLAATNDIVVAVIVNFGTFVMQPKQAVNVWKQISAPKGVLSVMSSGSLFFFKTSDPFIVQVTADGQKWQSVNVTIPMTSIQFIESKKVYVAGGLGGALAVSSDGLQWTPQTPIDTGFPIDYVTYLSSNNLWVASSFASAAVWTSEEL